MTRGWFARILAVLTVVGFAVVGAVSPAVAAEPITVEPLTVENRPYGSYGAVHQEFTAPYGHTLRIHVPQPLAGFWYGVSYAECTPANAIKGVTERLCTISDPNRRPLLSYQFPIAPDQLADQTFTVTVTDLDSDPPSSGTGTVSVVRRADLRLEYLSVFQSGSVGNFYPQVRYSYMNHGPTESLPATLTLTFSGLAVFGSLPSNCTRNDTVVTCALGAQSVLSPRGPLPLDLDAASGPFTVYGTLTSPTQDPDMSNNSREADWQGGYPTGGGSGGGSWSGDGGPSGSGGGAGGAGPGGAGSGSEPAAPAGTTPPAVAVSAGSSPSTASTGSSTPSSSLAAQPAASVGDASTGTLWWVTAAAAATAMAAVVGAVLLLRRHAAVAGSRRRRP